MKLLTKETDYAVRAVMNLAKRHDGLVSSREIAAQEEIPLQFLRRILQTLIRGGVVESREGASGGVRLKVGPAGIKVADLIRLFQGDIQLTECMFRKKICSNRKMCVLRRRIKRIEDMVAREFETMTIEDLLRDLEVQDEA
jgi:Rrf2 family cysteine metabolism transcriptional repressor